MVWQFRGWTRGEKYLRNVALRLSFICQGETSALRRGLFPFDEPLTIRAFGGAAFLANKLNAFDRAWCGPQLAANQTATALGLDARTDHALADIGYGRWSGRAVKEIEIVENQGFIAWLNGASPPDGEPIEQLLERTGEWLASRVHERGSVVAVVSPAVVRAGVIKALGAPPQSFLRLDVRPLTVTEMTSDGKRWNLRSMGHRWHDGE